LHFLQACKRAIEEGGDVTILSKEQREVLLSAAIWDDSTKVALQLIASGVDVNRKIDGIPLTQGLVGHFNRKVYDTLICSGLDVRIQMHCGLSMLHRTCHFPESEGKVDLMRKLIRDGANLDEFSHEGLLPIHIAARMGNTAMCCELLSLGVSPNAPALDGRTPLFMAAGAGKMKTCTELIARGADPFFMHKGRSLWSHANAKGNKEAGAQLKSVMASIKATQAVERAMSTALAGGPR
jgi:ankyrin repeat protein